MERSKNVVIIPALNEGKTIASVVESLLPFASVIVVDDGSADETEAKAVAAGAQVVRHTHNKGYEAALGSGFQKASDLKFEFVVTFDADGQHSPDMAKLFFERLQSTQLDLILGVRPKKARVSEKIMGAYFQRRFGITDVLCGLKGYRIGIYQRLGHFDQLRAIGAEIVLFAAKNGFRYEQIPVPIRERNDQPRFGNVWRSNLKILRALANMVKLDLA